MALADICFDSGSSGLSRRLLGLLGVMPKKNMMMKEEYAARMVKMGYEDVQMEDITEHVFPGFVPFLSTRGFTWRIFASAIRLLWSAGARFVVVSGRRAAAR